MFVVCAGSSTIWLYSSESYGLLDRTIELDGMKDPIDIVSCDHDRQLYVAGADTHSTSPSIWKVSANDQSYDRFSDVQRFIILWL